MSGHVSPHWFARLKWQLRDVSAYFGGLDKSTNPIFNANQMASLAPSGTSWNLEIYQSNLWCKKPNMFFSFPLELDSPINWDPIPLIPSYCNCTPCKNWIWEGGLDGWIWNGWIYTPYHSGPKKAGSLLVSPAGNNRFSIGTSFHNWIPGRYTGTTFDPFKLGEWFHPLFEQPKFWLINH